MLLSPKQLLQKGLEAAAAALLACFYGCRYNEVAAAGLVAEACPILCAAAAAAVVAK
jgi:hypothetical protein